PMIGNRLHRQRGWSLMAVGLLLAPLACAHPPPTPTAQKPEAPASPVTTAKVTSGPLAETITYSGNLQAESTVSVRPRATGRLERLTVDVGSAVRAGEEIASLDRAQLEASVLQAEGALQVAQAKLDLVLSGARPEDVDAARAQLAAAETKLEQYNTGGRTPD